MRDTLLGFVRASHPEPAVAVTAVAVLLAVGVGHPAGGAATVGATVFASQLATGWSNDWLDARRDAAARRTGKPLVAFAQTGSALLPRFLGAGLTAVSAEPYPFFWLDGGPTTIYRYRAADGARC